MLLKDENGYLHQMVQQTGHAVAESLFRAAQMVCNTSVAELAIVLHCQTDGRLEVLYCLHRTSSLPQVRQFIAVT